MPQTVNFAWKDAELAWRFSTGVCLHGHTVHSEECLSFLPRYLHKVPVISQIVGGYERGRTGLDFGRAFWTPPLSPASALGIERKQIENMDLRSLVSLTDHDNIDGGMALQIHQPCYRSAAAFDWLHRPIQDAEFGVEGPGSFPGSLAAIKNKYTGSGLWRR